MAFLSNYFVSPCLHTIFILSCIFTLNHANSMSQNSTNNMSTLMSIKSVLYDPFGSLASWGTDSVHYCNWRGITCHKKYTTKVSVLNLDSFGVNGFISPQIANLTFLHTINLANNNFHGFIPSELCLLSNLRYLNLKNNTLSGSIPNGLGSLPKLHTLILRRNNLEGSLFTLLENTSVSIRNIDIAVNNIIGEIPPTLFNNSHLQHLDLTDNKISGVLQVFPGASSSLKYLSVGVNNLFGHIPDSLCTMSSSLEQLILSDNKFSGSIPSCFGNCSIKLLYLHNNLLTGALPPFSPDSVLQDITIYENQLSGGLPSSLGNNSHFLYLCFSKNYLSGNIQDSLGRLSNLVVLDLAKNSFTGEIPSSIYNLTFLTYFGVDANQLIGRIPKNIGITLPNIQKLYFVANNFNGPVPNSLINMTSLEMIDFSGNSLSGFIPSSLGSLKNLRDFSLGRNKLETLDWKFLSSLTNCTLLERINLEDNKIIGTLPNFIGNFSNLKNLLIGMNHLNGPIPSEIGNLAGLVELKMDDCQCTGNIPSALGNIQHLEYLDMSGNNLSGPIPFSVGNLTKLFEVHMESNKLTGRIPSAFKNCTSLAFLNLSHNYFREVPEELFSLFSLSKALDLSNNLISGSLPGEVGKLISLSLLDISKNNFSQEIPEALGQCVVLQYLYMSDNSFQGNIPPSFRSLTNLKFLDLSRNQLDGRIPNFFKDDNSLEFLNLAYNDLEEMMPAGGLFANRTRFSVVGNKKLCGGVKELELPACKSTKKRFQFHKSESLVIALFSVGFFCLVSYLVTIRWQRRKRKTILSSPSNNLNGITYRDIVKATNEFSPENLIGSGSSSSVYKGKFDFSEKLVAIKVFNVQHSRFIKSFDAECKALRKLRHRNLLKPITLCSSLDSKGNEFKALLFDYMHNGSLEDWLHPKLDAQLEHRSLNLKQRMSIVADVAFALNYLHHEQGNSSVVHGDIKPSNVLLDSDMTAHLTDFGLSRFFIDSSSTSSLGELKGTIGYTPPEYGLGCTVSKQGDVYSFGVLVLEMLTGRKPTDCIFKDGLNICKLVQTAYPDKITEVLDPVLVEENNIEANHTNTKLKYPSNPSIECIVMLVEIGLSCCNDSPRERMEMKDAANKICSIKKYLLEL